MGPPARIVVASDECYLELPWDAQPVTVLHPSVSEGSMRGLLAVRKHAGMMVPAPVQTALIAALGDDAHVAEQRARYGARRARLRPALQAAGWRVTQSAVHSGWSRSRTNVVLNTSRRQSCTLCY